MTTEHNKVWEHNRRVCETLARAHTIIGDATSYPNFISFTKWHFAIVDNGYGDDDDFHILIQRVGKGESNLVQLEVRSKEVIVTYKADVIYQTNKIGKGDAIQALRSCLASEYCELN